VGAERVMLETHASHTHAYARARTHSRGKHDNFIHLFFEGEKLIWDSPLHGSALNSCSTKEILCFTKAWGSLLSLQLVQKGKIIYDI